MANETIGKIVCGWCGECADVRKACKGRQKLYVMCKNCGQQWLNTAGGQDIILSNATMYGVGGAPAEDRPSNKEVAAAIIKAVERQTLPPEKRRSVFDLDI